MLDASSYHGCRDIIGQRSFVFSGSSVWNNLPQALCDCSLSWNTFKQKLKILFKQWETLSGTIVEFYDFWCRETSVLTYLRTLLSFVGNLTHCIICRWCVVAFRLYSFRPIATLNSTTRMVAIIAHVYQCMEEISSITSHLLNCTSLEQGSFSRALIHISITGPQIRYAKFTKQNVKIQSYSPTPLAAVYLPSWWCILAHHHGCHGYKWRPSHIHRDPKKTGPPPADCL